MKKKAQDHYEEAKASNQRTPRSVGHMHTVVVERLFFRMILTGPVVVFPSLISGFDDWRTGKIVFFDGRGQGPLESASIPRVLACRLELFGVRGMNELKDTN